MAFQFPASPVLGQIFEPTPGTSYKWNGTGWSPYSTLFPGGGTFTGPVLHADGTVSAPGISWANDPDTGIIRDGSSGMHFVLNGTTIISMTGTTFNVGVPAGFYQPTKFADGTLAVPSISWVSDTDTGFYRSGNDQFAVSLGGASPMEWALGQTFCRNDFNLNNSRSIRSYNASGSAIWPLLRADSGNKVYVGAPEWAADTIIYGGNNNITINGSGVTCGTINCGGHIIGSYDITASRDLYVNNNAAVSGALTVNGGSSLNGGLSVVGGIQLRDPVSAYSSSLVQYPSDSRLVLTRDAGNWGTGAIHMWNNRIELDAGNQNLTYWPGSDLTVQGLGTTTDGASMATPWTGNSHALRVSVSARRFKKELQPLSDTTDKVMALKPLTYLSAIERDITDRLPGFTAEDFVEVGLTEYVRYRDGEPEGLRYERVCVLLTKALQETIVRVENLDARTRSPLGVAPASDVNQLTGALSRVLKLRGVRFQNLDTGQSDIRLDDLALEYPELATSDSRLTAPIVEALREINDRLTALERQ